MTIQSDSRLTFAINFAAALLLAVMLGSCTKPEPKPATTKTDLKLVLNLTVDSTLLGETLSLGDIALRAPRGWAPVDQQIMDYMRNHAAKEEGLYRLTPLASFTHSSGSVMVVSSFANEPAVEFKQFALRVSKAYRDARIGLNPQESWIAINGLSALQVYAVTESTAHLKIILGAGIPLSLDYTIPRQSWETQQRAVESSLASAHIKRGDEIMQR